MRLDVGNQVVWGETLAVASGWFEPGRDPFDLAFVLLQQNACAAEATCLFEPFEAAKGAVATLLGFAERIAKPIEVGLKQAGALLEYAINDAPGYSGGPIITRVEGDRPVVAGVHHFFDGIRNMGVAIALSKELVAEACTALGFAWDEGEK